MRLLIASLGIIILPHSAVAASLDFTSSSLIPTVGRPVEITLSIASGGSNINALEGEIVVPESMEILSIRQGSSIIPLWLETPSVDGQRVLFAGIIPGGWPVGDSATRGAILTFVVVPRGAGEYSLSVASSTKVLLNDGAGTTANVRTTPLILRVREAGAEGAAMPVLRDTIPPEPFVPVVSRSDNIFNGDYFIAFATTDRESGLLHYEIAEVRGWTIATRMSWRRATSPERLHDQNLQSTVYIKAIDEEGNERIAVVGPASRGHAPIALVVFIAISWIFWLYRKRLCHSFKISSRYGR